MNPMPQGSAGPVIPFVEKRRAKEKREEVVSLRDSQRIPIA